MNVVSFQSEVMTDRVGEVDNSTSDTHQRAEDLLKFINNITMDINGEREPRCTFVHLFAYQPQAGYK